MHSLIRPAGLAILIAGLYYSPQSPGSESSNLYYRFILNLETTRLDNLSLGDDADVDRLDTGEYELELELEYSLSDHAYLFLDVSLIDDSEIVEPNGDRETESGLERTQMGVAFSFGEDIPSELKLGRMEFLSISEWWIWWDEELDAVSLETGFGRVNGLLAVAEEQAPENTDIDYIDPEMKDVQRVIASLGWEFADDQLLVLYYLDQEDDSGSFAEGDVADAEELDEADADLTWSGIGYFGGLQSEGLGELAFELHYAQVRGDETLVEFEDAENGLSEAGEREMRRVSGDAQSYLLAWKPPGLDDWTFSLGEARGSGDASPDDGRDESFRQTGLQGDSEVFGQLYQPELSNLEIQVVALSWKVARNYELQLFGYDYAQRRASEEIRDVSIEFDVNGVDRDLGREIDLVLIVEPLHNLELVLIAAEFEAGEAYGEREGERSRFYSIELEYVF